MCGTLNKAHTTDSCYYLHHLILGGGSPFTATRAEEIFRQFFGDMDLSSIFGQEFATSAPHQV